jgi:uncharacterized protein
MQIGIYHNLEILRFTSVGAFLGNEQGEEILLPNKYLDKDYNVGDTIEVFVYKDSKERPVATTLKPHATLHQFGYFKVNWINNAGAFVDWGLEKDILVPLPEQKFNLQEGNEYLLYIKYDEKTDRLFGTTRFAEVFSKETAGLEMNQEVELLICDETELGRKVIVNDLFQGLIFKNHIIRPLIHGQRIKGFIKNIREDGKLDVTLEKNSLEKFDENTETVLAALHQNHGTLFFGDHSDPEMIRAYFHMSKKSFKKAIGNLYRDQLIRIFDDRIELVKEN